MLAIMVALGACRDDTRKDDANADAAPGGVERFGLVSAPEDYALVSAAVEASQKILPRVKGVALRLGWKAPFPRRSVPVFAVRASGLGKLELMATYKECGCILVNAAALSAWTVAHMGSSSALLSTDARYLLSYMLLHEAGHIVSDGNVSATDESGSPASTSLNLDPTAQKERENNADTFAANAIRAALNAKGDAGLAAARIAMTLSQVSYNLSAHRLLDDFGGTPLRKRSLFWDSGLSHPNLEWRILNVNNMIESTATSRQLLQEFEEAREGGKTPYRLYGK